MASLFVLQNQHLLLLTKQREWSDGREVQRLFSTPHRDVALNEMIEVNAKDISQRIVILECETSERGQPLIPAEHMPPPLPTEIPEAGSVAEPALSGSPDAD